MPRTANAIDTEKPLTFMQGETRDTGADYHFLMLTVGPHPLPDGTITGDQADARVNNWIANGYKLAEVHFLGKHEQPGQGFGGFQFAYHFIKE